MPEFLAQNNACGQTVLQLVSRGNAIIAELLRLKDYIPNIYRFDFIQTNSYFLLISFLIRLETKSLQQKYAEIIMDFSYFKIAEAQEQRIESNEVSCSVLLYLLFLLVSIYF